MKWSMKRFTFVVIPDANGSIKRVNLPAFIVILIPVIFVLLILSVILLYLLYSGNAGSISSLEHKLADSSSQYERMLTDKNNNIDSLQTQVVSLSEKAQSIQQKLEEVDKLESQVKSMVGLKSSGTSKKPVPADATIEDGDPQDGGVGGEDIPVTDEEFAQLVTDTFTGFTSLDPALEETKSRLEKTKSDVAKVQAAQKKIPTIWPTDNRRITSQYGVRKDPFNGSARFHAGIDIAGSVGDPIYATADGVVVHSEKDDAEGNNITIDHGNGIRTRYMHMSKLIAKVGDEVSKGDVIGELGSTGRSTGPHMHYEVLVSGKTTDPMEYLN